MKTIYYFTADWCNPCQRTRPITDELKREGMIDFLYVDVDTEIELSKQFGIKSIPTYILIQNGVEVKRMNGAKTRQEFLDFIDV